MFISLRQGLVGLVAIVGAFGTQACSGSVDSVRPSGETTGEDQSLLKEGACFGESLGGATSCKPAEVWKKYVAESCESRGLSVGEFNLGSACGPSTDPNSKDAVLGSFDSVKYTCCKSAPIPVPPKPGPDPVPACFGDAQGGPTSCKPADVWTKYASDLCIAKGFKITRIDFAEECGDKGSGSFRYTKYECCDGSAPPPPPPPPPACKTVELGDKTSCKPNGTWKEYAFDFCYQAKMTLTNLSVGGACAPDASQFAKVTCCEETAPAPVPGPEPKPLPPEPKPEPTPVPPEPTACVWNGGDGCAEPAQWKEIAYASCQKQGLTLNELTFGSACIAGGTTAKYSCCK